MSKNTTDELYKILKDYRSNLTQQMGLILSGRHRLNVETADKYLIDEPIQAIEQLISNREKLAYKDGYIKGGIDEILRHVCGSTDIQDIADQ